jgi:replication factor A1
MGHLSWLTLDDETGSSRLVFWNERAEEVLEFQPGDVIRVEGANGREGLGGVPEAHLRNQTRITKVQDKAILKQLETIEPVSHGILTIQEVKPGLQVAEILGKVVGVGQSRQFTRKDGSPSQVMNLLLKDHTGTIRTVLWGDQVPSGELLRPGAVVQITNANARSGRFGGVEVHLGDRSTLISNPKDAEKMEFDPPALEINQIRPDTGTVNIKGKLLGTPQKREFTRDDGSEGQVASVDIADTTGVCRVVAWGNEVEKLEALEENDVIQVIGGSVREGRDGIEIHLSDLSGLTVLEHEELDLGEITQEMGASGDRTYYRKSLKEIKRGDYVELRATVVKIFDRDPTYLACPQCLRKVRPKGDAMECNQHGVVDPIHHMIFSMILDDGSANIRATLGGTVAEEFLQLSAEEAYRLGTELGLPEAPILREKQRLEGQELIVLGRIRSRRDRDEMDLMVDSIQTPNPEDELEKLLKVIQPE